MAKYMGRILCTCAGLRILSTMVFCILLSTILLAEDIVDDKAEDKSAPGNLPLADRPGLLDGSGSPVDVLRKHGMDLNVSYTEFGQGVISDQNNNGWKFGGKFYGRLNLNGEKLGLWRGFTISLLGEYTQGQSIDAVAGTLLPTNTALYGPADGKPGGDMSLTVTQRLGDTFTLSAGKFNMYVAASRTPILGGGGESFWNLGLAAPFTGVVPPYVTGFSLGINTKPAQLSFMIYDPKSAQQNAGISKWLQEGLTIRSSVMLPANLAGRKGYHTFVFVGSSKTGTDFADIPQLILPPESRPALGTKKGSYYGAYSLQQYLWQDPNKPDAGWGIFAQFGISDSNPNPLRWMMFAGMAGTGIISHRPLDQFGAGYFKYAISKELISGLELFDIHMGAEQGGEFYYKFAITRWFRVTADLQVVAPGNQDTDTVIVAGFSARVQL